MATYIGNIPVPQATQTRQTFTATASQTTFATVGYTVGFVDVYLNGVKLVDGTDYTATNGSDVVLTTGAAASDTLEVISYSTYEVNSQNYTGDLSVDVDTLYVDSTNDRVGIGTSSPSQILHLKDTGINTVLLIEGSTAGGSFVNFADTTDTNVGQIGYDHTSNYMKFRTNDAEAMRIDSSGNLLVGKTSADGGVEGVELHSDGELYLTRDSDRCAIFRRLTTEGYFVQFNQGTTRYGTLGADGSGRFVIDGGSGDSGLRFGGVSVTPRDNGSASDNLNDFGSSTNRWDDIYATNGTIQTSDQNEKQQIASLTDAEITAAKAISKLFKTFKWNDSVAEKGDAARTHTGVIAQEVEQAMTDAGLNAGDYAFFISTTWWEANGETYGTLEEAPEGATERNRKGIRYPQLLSFIGAATEQRLASTKRSRPYRV